MLVSKNANLQQPILFQGGFDPRVDENAQVLQELRSLCQAEGFEENVDVSYYFGHILIDNI